MFFLLPSITERLGWDRIYALRNAFIDSLAVWDWEGGGKESQRMGLGQVPWLSSYHIIGSILGNVLLPLKCGLWLFDILTDKFSKLHSLTCFFPLLAALLSFFSCQNISVSIFQSLVALLQINFVVWTGPSGEGIHLWSAQHCLYGGEIQPVLC